MDEKVLASLILILQKHANAIRKLQSASIALMTWAREEAIRAGVPMIPKSQETAEEVAV